MTPNTSATPQKKIHSRIVRIASAATALGLVVPVLLHTYGHSTLVSEQLISFGSVDLAIKAALASSMVILIFFSRPRSPYLRILVGLCAAAALVYANYGAFSGTLALGDGVLYFIGSLVAMSETVEAKLPHRSHLPAHALHQAPTMRV